VILPRFDAEETLAAVERHRGTWIYLVPTMMSRIWRLPETTRAPSYDVSSLPGPSGTWPRPARPG
jgi:bile acid-coenzyme A ligase